jgi:ribosomal-protein-alanine N-acetyltransferase
MQAMFSLWKRGLLSGRFRLFKLYNTRRRRGEDGEIAVSITLETSRLLMREFQEEDAVGMYELNSDPDVIRYTGDDPFASVKAAGDFIRKYDAYAKTGYGRLTILLKSTLQYAGWCGLKLDPASSETDLGFRLHKKFWNQGYATEASLRCIDFGFKELNLDKIVGRAMQENKASINVLKKIGMAFEKDFEAHGGICVQYCIYKK